MKKTSQRCSVVGRRVWPAGVAMAMAMGLAVVGVGATSTAFSPECIALANPATIDSACKFGGRFTVTANPSGVIVNNTVCSPTLDKTLFALQPTATYADATTGEYYTLMMLDKNAPGHPAGYYYLLWLVANIPGADFVTGKLSAGTVVTKYMAPNPIANSGTHKYMFLVFHHHDSGARITGTITDRARFKIFNWIKRLPPNTLDCPPVAGVEFQSSF